MLDNIPAELIAALLLLGLTVVGGMTEIVRRLVANIVAKLDHNTDITARVEKQTNGHVEEMRQRLTKVSLLAERYKWILDDIRATPNGRQLVLEALQRHQTVRSDKVDALLERLISEELEPARPGLGKVSRRPDRADVEDQL